MWRASRLARVGTAEPFSRDPILMRAQGQGNIHFPCSTYRYNHDRHLDGLVFREFAPAAFDGSRVIIVALVHLKPTTRTRSSGRAIIYIPLPLLSSLSNFVVYNTDTSSVLKSFPGKESRHLPRWESALINTPKAEGVRQIGLREAITYCASKN